MKKLKKLTIIGSFLVVFFIIFSSCSSVVAYQSTKSELHNRIKEIVSDIDDDDIDKELLINRVYDVLEENDEERKYYMGPILILILTILTEYVIYVDYLSDANPLVLLLLSIIINLLTNPAVNFTYYFFYRNVPVLEYIAYKVEIYMIFVLFNLFMQNISFEDADELSKTANEGSYLFCHELNKKLTDFINGILPN